MFYSVQNYISQLFINKHLSCTGECLYCCLTKSTIQFCEQNTSSIVIQPINAISSLIYALFGFIIYIKYGKENRGIALSFMFVSFFISVFSYFYHATDSYLGLILDITSMYLLSVMILSISIKRYFYLSIIKTLILYTLILVTSVITLVIVGSVYGAIIFVFHIIVATFSEILYIKLKRKVLKQVRLIVISIATCAVAFILWSTDAILHDCFTNKAPFLNAHAWWHVLTSFSLYFVAKFFIKNSLKNKKSL